MELTRILVAEDDVNILNGLVDTLESEGYNVTAAGDGEKALDVFNSERFDLIILDVMMPGKSGYDVCRAIRAQDEDVPVIMLTAKGEEIDKVVGLQLGADDYITKPFGIHELLARISAILRRAKRNAGQNNKSSDEAPEVFSFGLAKINVLKFRARVGDKTFDLSARELKLLQLFYKHKGEALSREKLLNDVWGIEYYGTTRTLDQHIAQLRKKIEPDPANPGVIKTVHGVGYRYEEE